VSDKTICRQAVVKLNWHNVIELGAGGCTLLDYWEDCGLSHVPHMLNTALMVPGSNAAIVVLFR